MHVNEIAQYIEEQEDFELIGFADVPPEVPEKTQARYTRDWNRENNSKKKKKKLDQTKTSNKSKNNNSQKSK